MNTNPRILLVDDIASTDADVIDGLINIGITPDIEFINPKDRKILIEDKLPKRSELDEYDIALIDIELYSPNAEEKYDLELFSGGTKVLPYLRKNAPWIPTIAASKLFSEEDPAMQTLAGSFGFDGQIPRKMFPTRKIRR